MQTFESSFGKVAYDIVGTGEPLIMIHGTPSSSYIWREFIQVLKHQFRIHYFDLLGYGESEMKAGDVSLGVQNRILKELIEYWQLERPIMVAHDFGGATALRGLVLNGLRYKKLVLIDVVALAPWGSPFVQHVRHHEEVFNQIPDYIHKAMVQRYLRDALHKPISDTDLEPFVQPWITRAGKAAFYRQIAQMDQRYTDEVQQHYSQITAPTLILWGEHDNWIPIAKGQELHAAIPNSEFVPVPDAGHFAQVDNPAFILGEILRFLTAK
jgi:pimeloyl-ACP methyl ester carboxylesterase